MGFWVLPAWTTIRYALAEGRDKGKVSEVFGKRLLMQK
jgi:hypothetical protein